MKKLLRAIIGVVLSAVAAQTVTAEEPTWNYAVQISATVQESPARITLSWPQDTSGTPGSYTVYRKSAGNSSWGSGTSLSGNTLTYTDTSVAVGTAYEYQIVKAMGGYSGYGYIYTGINVPLVDSRGKVILVVDNTVAGPLASELARLEKDLVGDGWTVVRRDVSRNDSAANVKNVIRSVYNSDAANTKSVFLFGHVPVPYSGNIVPDGHYPDHQGAWPADGYYGDMDGNWTDNSVNSTSANEARNRNVPGDGKFDQSNMPSPVELQVGRVDLANMPGRKVWGGPATFPSEIELLRNYLNKDHNFRHKRINPPARAVLHDSFGVRGGEAFAGSGYRSFAPLVGANQILTLPNKGTWIPHLRDNQYLLAYGAGAGSYSSIGGLGNTGQYQDGTTTEIVENDVKAAFTMLFGSWLGDWDAEDNIMRGILATPSMGLVCAWSGRPHWFYHHLGMGVPIGYAALIAQNNPNGGLYRNQINSAAGSIHLGLMGDPTLRLHPVAPPSGVSVSSGRVSWTASTDSVVGYHVYRASNEAGPFTRITSAPVTSTSYTDGASGTYVYMVKAVKLQSSPSGTYYNSSQGVTAPGSGGGGGGGGDTTQPTVSISAPSGGTTVSGSSVSVSANASDDVGVVGVQFKLDGANLDAEDTTAPFTLTWDSTTSPNGSHTLTAVARDAAGNQQTSSAVTVSVSNSSGGGGTGTPSVTVTATDATAVEGFDNPATFRFARTGDTSVGLTVSFNLAGTATKWTDYRRRVEGDMPVSITIPAGAASADLTVHAWPDTETEPTETCVLTVTAGAGYTVGSPSSATISLSDTGGGPVVDTTPPAIAITAPAGGATVSGSSVAVSANASDNVGVVGVQFKLDGANLGAEDTTAPYSVTWDSTTAPNGSHTLTAVARDAAGNQSTSSAVAVNVSNSSGGGGGGGGTPSISVVAIDAQAVEGFDDPATFRFTRAGDTSAALTVSFNLAGTAIKWTDYRRRVEGDMPVSISIPAGATTADLTVHAWPDTETESTETCILTVTAGSGYTVGSPASATISMSDTGSGPDTAPPVIAITAPPPSSIAVGTAVNLSASASDNVGVAGVQFRVNGSSVGAEDTTSPYGTTWSTTGLSTGAYLISAVARDTTGNRATSAVVNVTLSSTPPPGTNTNVVITSNSQNILQLADAGDHQLRILSPTVLELQLITRKDPDPAPPSTWNFVNSSQQLSAPAASEFNVTANGQPIAVQSVGFKRRPLYAPLNTRDLRLENSLYLHLASPIAEGQSVQVHNPSGSIITSSMQFTNVASVTRYSPAIHVNQEGYVPGFVKQAMVGYYLGSGGELDIPAANGFKIVTADNGATVFQGALTLRRDIGSPVVPTPYQKVYEADFTSFRTPGEYLLVVPGLGASLPFLIDEGIAMGFARSYALGLYHQRCGGAVGFPHSRHDHAACHVAQADIPLPASSFQYTWNKIAEKSGENVNPRQTAPQLRDEASQLYPIINRGKIDISHGHHDAGDYSKYTINSAGLLHHLIFAVDSLAGVAALDNLGLPESGDGISDVMQLARWEADFLSKIQDADGGFYFLIYPRNRAYESDVPPDRGDAQVVWPKTTSATAAAVAALAQIASSPRFKAAYPTEAAAHLAKAKLGWQFLINAINRHGKDGAYQKITHYGDQFMHDDELAWAAASLFAATGEAQYHTKLKEWYDPASPSTLHWGWWRLYEGYGCAVRTYAFAARSGRLQASQLDSAYLAKCDQQITLAAQDRTTDAREHAYGSSFPAATKRILSAGWFFSNERAFDIAVGYQLDPRADYAEAMVSNMNYEGGCNPVNMPHITGMGWKRQRQIVHQWAHNDRRALPPSGIPQGNIVSHFSYLENYKGELNAMCFPGNDTGSGRYAMYDRWSDVHNVTAEFVNVDQARGLGALAFLATLTQAKSTPWKSAPSATINVQSETSVGGAVTATLQVPGMDLSGARILWEAKDNEPAFGSTYTFSPKAFGGQWVEVEAQWPDGRRAFAKADLYATNHLPIVTVAATVPVASENPPVNGVFTFTRKGGNINTPLTVNFKYSGTATKWDDYHRPEGDTPESVTIPAGASSTTLTLVARRDSVSEQAETVNITITPNSNYELGLTPSATMTINETGGTQISAIRRSSNGDMTVTWNSQSGTLYQILYKDSLAETGWRTLQTGIAATGVTTSFLDRSAASVPMRFYIITTL